MKNKTSQDQDKNLKIFKSRNFIHRDFDNQRSSSKIDSLEISQNKVNITARKHKKFLSEVNSRHIQSKNEYVKGFNDLSAREVVDPKNKKNSKIIYQGQTIIDYIDLYPLINFEYKSPKPQNEE